MPTDKNEILGLTWDEIDEAGGVIRLSPARSKTLVGRILPISQPIADALDRRRARRDPDSPLVFHGVVGRRCTNRHWPARCPPTGSSPADAIRRWSAEGGHPIHRRGEREPGCRPANSQRGTSSYTWDKPSTASLQCGSCGDEKGGPSRLTRRRSFMQQRRTWPPRPEKGPHRRFAGLIVNREGGMAAPDACEEQRCQSRTAVWLLACGGA